MPKIFPNLLLIDLTGNLLKGNFKKMVPGFTRIRPANEKKKEFGYVRHYNRFLSAPNRLYRKVLLTEMSLDTKNFI